MNQMEMSIKINTALELMQNSKAELEKFTDDCQLSYLFLAQSYQQRAIELLQTVDKALNG